MTGHPWKAFGAGIAAGTVAPSSTALSVLSVQMIQTGRLDAQNMLAVLLGSGIGMTISAQLLATGSTNNTGLLLILGVFGFQMLSRELYRGIGQCMLALGLLFLGLEEISAGATALANDPAAKGVLEFALGNPASALAIAAVSAVIFQSSTATIGLAIGLSAGALFPLAAMVPWIVGTNIGVSITSLLVGWRSIEGRRLGSASLLTRGTIALVALFFADSIIKNLLALPFSSLRQIALLHTGFNLVAGIMGVALLVPITRLTQYLVSPQPGSDPNQKPDFLDQKALVSPSLALAQATRQTQLMADQIHTMLEQYWVAEGTRNTDLAKKIQKEDDDIDKYNIDISNYLSRIDEGMRQEDTQWQFTLLAFSNELESVGDIIDKNLCDSVIKRATELIVFTPLEMEVLTQVHQSLAERLRVAIGFLAWRDVDAAREFLNKKESFNDWCRQLEKEHFQRLKSREAATISSSPYFLDILNSFRRINSHITSIGYAFENPE